MPRQPLTYRFQGKSAFLTYPKCDLTPTSVLDYLYNLLKNYDIFYARVCQENHQDGTKHLHCLVQLAKRLTTRDPKYFDITTANTITSGDAQPHHPNIQVPRSDAHVADYIAKDGNFVERGVLKATRRSPKKSRDTIWTAILQESTSKPDFLARVQSEQPYTWATQLRNLEYAANSRWPEPPVLYEPRYRAFPNLPEPIKQWAETNLYTVSFNSMQLIDPDIEHADLDWASNTAQEELEEQLLLNSQQPITVSDAGPQT
ncbi:RepA [Plantago lanceolata latent virus]|uniref:Replication-associated protein n=1 Tax=Plantago lanceolata latent virus TaxID=1830242 RepID=A0A166V5R3_9GEMI|nr:RepA [Plantago lanceolata latent virus]ANA76387.1 RepA [Plantago lanceolata latent virus]